MRSNRKNRWTELWSPPVSILGFIFGFFIVGAGFKVSILGLHGYWGWGAYGSFDVIENSD